MQQDKAQEDCNFTLARAYTCLYRLYIPGMRTSNASSWTCTCKHSQNTPTCSHTPALAHAWAHAHARMYTKTPIHPTTCTHACYPPPIHTPRASAHLPTI